MIPRSTFGVEELSARLEHAGVEYIRVAYGILDFNTDCFSGQLEPGDIGTAPPPKRGKLCKTCCFFAGVPEEQVSDMALIPAPQALVLVV
jgi:hypothetical protein